jgi:hypothetical protein
MKLTIETDGTKAGTKVMMDGMEVQNLSSIEFWMDSYSSHPHISHSTKEEDKMNHAVVTTHYRYDPSVASMVETDERGQHIVDTEDYNRM